MPPPANLSWSQHLQNAWVRESLGDFPPGLVALEDSELWRLVEKTNAAGTNLQCFDSWVSSLLAPRRTSGLFVGTVAEVAGIQDQVAAVVRGAIRHCSKCDGRVSYRSCAEIVDSIHRNFPQLRTFFAAPVKIEAELKRRMSLGDYLEMLGSFRVVIDGDLINAEDLEEDLRNSPP